MFKLLTFPKIKVSKIPFPPKVILCTAIKYYNRFNFSLISSQ